MELGFKNKVVILTGAGSGIGATTARLFAREGAKVVIVEVDDKKGLSVQNDIIQEGFFAQFIQTDVSSRESVKRMVDSIIGEFGTIDILVNNAAIYFKGDVLAFEESVFQRIIDVNVKGVLLCSQLVGRAMLQKRSGVIVNVASEAGLVAIPNQILYNLTKAAVISITKSCAVDFAEYDIRVNCVCPGTTYTPLVEEALRKEKEPEKTKKVLEEKRPLGRLGQPEEIATAILFLASSHIDYATGAVLSVDGGYTVW